LKKKGRENPPVRGLLPASGERTPLRSAPGQRKRRVETGGNVDGKKMGHLTVVSEHRHRQGFLERKRDIKSWGRNIVLGRWGGPVDPEEKTESSR